MNNSPVLHVVGKVSWALTAIASINMGLVALTGYDMFQYMPINLVGPVAILIGIAGVYSFVKMVTGCCCCSK